MADRTNVDQTRLWRDTDRRTIGFDPPGLGVDDVPATDDPAFDDEFGEDAPRDAALVAAEERRRAGVRGVARSAGVRLAWLAAAIVVALGSAGIVAATEHFPDLGQRPELTWAADNTLNATLDGRLDDLAQLSQDVDGLGEQARQARGALTQRDRVKLDAAIRTGSAAVASIGGRSAALSDALRCRDAAYLDTLSTQNSGGAIDRYRAMCAAVFSTATLRDDWLTVVNGTQQALEITDLLVDHDKIAASSTKLGSAGKYPDAIAELDGAYADLASINSRYEVLSKIADVWTLGQWLKRSQEFDDALKALWVALIDSKGKVNPKVQAAAKAVDEAKSLLPYDTSYLSVVLAEIAAIGVDDAAISIEQAKGRLSTAVGALGDGSP